MTRLEAWWDKVAQGPDCWLWTASADKRTGYGWFWNGRKMVGAHRWGYEQLVGPVPVGMELDHLCKTPGCVRPSHLEPVDHGTNIRRGNGVSVRNAAKTTCPQGHTYDQVDGQGKRRCLRCRRAQDRSRNRAR